jgi:hypothetical protein
VVPDRHRDPELIEGRSARLPAAVNNNETVLAPVLKLTDGL